MAAVDDIRFSSAEINIVVHATENEKKILQSLYDILLISAEKFTSSVYDGHWGNKILLLTATIDGQVAKELILKITSLLNSVDRYHLSNFFDKYVDEKGNLYIRLDKQRICKGRISLSDMDSIRIRFRPVKRYKPSSNLQNYRVLLALGE
ncbi:MAG TPA: RNA-binding domain-containing protein [Nitrososphaeraceae archaeon]|nr:RNA-binding domain-containing protein [Nitrososphaeraceae archaeon]